MSKRNRIDTALTQGTAQTIQATFKLNKAILKQLKEQIKRCKTPEQLLRVLTSAQAVLNETSLGRFCTLSANNALHLSDYREGALAYLDVSQSVAKPSQTKEDGPANGKAVIPTSPQALTDPVRDAFFQHH
jgi:hypothetical protein